MPEEDEPEYLTVVYETSSEALHEASGHDGTSGGVIGGAADSSVDNPDGNGDGTSSDAASGGPPPSVTVYVPGTVSYRDDGWAEYTFTANVDGRVGLVTISVESYRTEAFAAASAQRTLEENPQLLKGIG